MLTTVSGQKLRVLFLDVRRIGKHHGAKVTGRGSGPNGLVVSAIDQQRQSPRMIDVCVRKDDRVDLVDGQRELRILDAAFRTAALKHAAIEKHRSRPDAQDVTRPCYFTRSTTEFDLHFASSKG